MENPRIPFVEEINFEEIEILEVVGKGSFGVVKKGKWRNQFVAVKMILSESEKKAFIVERQQLSRVSHPNIVKLYGTCTKSPVCLVMEYAEGGSLYSVLHCSPQPVYTAAHAISWTHQCAMGVAYLHNMKPKALIHRDLKPPNLLLILGGTVLKICDFGTACDIQTQMTNNKGSAAWMAPEVFEGFKYSEKCDVFSWGIILWEVLTRRKPFDEIGRSAYSIMWAVHSGQRPPLIKGCPPDLETLMTSCWDKDPQKRPSMDNVVKVMESLRKYFKGDDEPIYYVNQDEVSVSDEDGTETSPKTSEENKSNETNESSSVSSQSETQILNEKTTSVITPPSLSNNEILTPLPPITLTQETTPLVRQKSPEIPFQRITQEMSPRTLQASAPASLANSRENLVNLPTHPGWKEPNVKRLSDEFSRLVIDNSKAEVEPHSSTHHRTGSYGSLNMAGETGPSLARELSLNHSPLKSEWLSTHHSPRIYQSNCRSYIQSPYVEQQQEQYGNNNSPPQENIEDLVRLMLEPQYQPLPPFPQSEESMQIYENHKKMAQECLQVQSELSIMMQRKADLAEQLSKLPSMQSYPADASKCYEEYLQLQSEKKGLQELHRNLKRQLEILREPPPRKLTGESWELLP